MLCREIKAAEEAAWPQRQNLSAAASLQAAPGTGPLYLTITVMLGACLVWLVASALLGKC